MSPYAPQSGPRIERYGVDLLLPSGAFVKSIRGVESGTVSNNMDREIHGTLDLTLREDTGIDWMVHQFRPWVQVNSERWPLGVYLPDSPELINDFDGRMRRVTMLDKISILVDARITNTLSLAAGHDALSYIKTLTATVKYITLSITDDGKPHGIRTPVTWTAGTTYLRIINDLLSMINYAGAWCDGAGVVHLEPYIEPEKRPVDFVFEAGADAIHRAEWSRKQDIIGVPNRVILTTTGDDKTPGLRARADDVDPASPYSWQARGERWVSVHENVEAVDQAALDALAARRLRELQRARASYTLHHAAVRGVWPRRIVRLISGDVNALCQVNEVRVPLQVGAMTDTLLMEVST